MPTTVTGYRKSLQEATTAKRESITFTDSVFAEDIGKILPNLRLTPGAHALEVYALDPGVVLDRFEIAFDGAPHAYSPVPETRIRRAEGHPAARR